MNVKKLTITAISIFVLAVTSVALFLVFSASSRLETPNGINVTADGHLSWNKVDGATHYMVYVGENRHLTTDNCFDLLEEITDYGSYKFSVSALDCEDENKDSRPSKPYTYDITLKADLFDYSTLTNSVTISLKTELDESQIPEMLLIPSLSPDGRAITTIGSFSNDKVKVVYMPDSVKRISAYAFDGCENLARVRLSRNLESINKQAFANCESMTSLTLPDEVQLSLDLTAIDGCSSLTNLHIPANVTPQSLTAFKGCDALKTITVDEENEFYTVENNCFLYNAETAFKKQKTLIKALDGFVIPQDTTTVSDYAFEKVSVSKITLPSSVTAAYSPTFYDCDKLEEVVISEGFSAFYNSSYLPSFYDCPNLKKISLPSTLENVPFNLFYKCDNLTTLKISSGNTKFKADGTFVISGNTVICGTRADHFPSYVTEISDYAYARSSVTQAIIPDTISKIGQNAFAYCNDLKKVELSENLQTIDKYTFRSCTELETIVLPSSVRTIEDGAFYGCQKLSVVIPTGVNIIKARAFYGATVYTDKQSGDNWFHMTYDDWGNECYRFGGWIFGGVELKQDEKGHSYVESFTYTAEENNSSLIDFTNYFPAEGYNNRAVPCRDGYTFKGWATEKDGEAVYKPFVCTPQDSEPYYATLSDDELATLSSGTTLYAVWEKN